LVIRTPISNPSLRSIHISYANLQVEPRQAEASGSEIVRYVEASARSGAKGDKFGAKWTRAKLWRAGGFFSSRSFKISPDAGKPAIVLSPSTRNTAIPAGNRSTNRSQRN
jgi:hypothetical protein